jgi:hypothetical protein
MFEIMGRLHYLTEEYLTEKVESNKPCISVIGYDNFYSSKCMSLEDAIEFVSNHNYDLIYLDAGHGFGSLKIMTFKKSS